MLSLIDNHLQMKTEFFPRESHFYKGGRHAQKSGWGTKNELWNIFGSSLSYFFLSRFIYWFYLNWLHVINYIYFTYMHIYNVLYFYIFLSFHAIGPLCIYYRFQFSVFKKFLSVRISGSLSACQFLVPFLGLLFFCFFCLFVLPYSNMLVFV